MNKNPTQKKQVLDEFDEKELEEFYSDIEIDYLQSFLINEFDVSLNHCFDNYFAE